MQVSNSAKLTAFLIPFLIEFNVTSQLKAAICAASCSWRTTALHGSVIFDDFIAALQGHFKDFLFACCVSTQAKSKTEYPCWQRFVVGTRTLE